MTATLTVEQIIPICGAITAMMMAFGRYVMPVIIRWFGFKAREDEMKDRVYKLETNHIVHIQADVDRIESTMNKKFDQVFSIVNNHASSIARLDERTKK